MQLVNGEKKTSRICKKCCNFSFLSKPLLKNLIFNILNMFNQKFEDKGFIFKCLNILLFALGSLAKNITRLPWSILIHTYLFAGFMYIIGTLYFSYVSDLLSTINQVLFSKVFVSIISYNTRKRGQPNCKSGYFSILFTKQQLLDCTRRQIIYSRQLCKLGFITWLLIFTYNFW